MDEFDDDSGTIFRDVILLALAAFVAMVLMLLPFLNPSAEAEIEAEGMADPGNVIIELLWAADRDADIDLWVKAPDRLPVGFPNKGNEVVNLLRDDLGLFQDLTDINYEIVYSRGIVPGEWIVNVQAYRLEDPISAGSGGCPGGRQRQARGRGTGRRRSWRRRSSCAIRATRRPCSASRSPAKARWCTAASTTSGSR